MLRIRVVEEIEGVHIRSKSFSPGKDADYEFLCTLMEKIGFTPSGKTAKLRLRFLRALWPGLPR